MDKLDLTAEVNMLSQNQRSMVEEIEPPTPSILKPDHRMFDETINYTPMETKNEHKKSSMVAHKLARKSVVSDEINEDLFAQMTDLG